MKLESFLEESKDKVTETFKKQEEVKETYTNSCDLFMLGKDDPKRAASDQFFKFFNEFVDSVEKALPKAEKKKPSASASKLKKAGGLVISAAELAKASSKMRG